MEKSFIIIALFSILAFAIHSSLTSELNGNAQSDSAVSRHRVRRYLAFQNHSRILFRVNIKDNIIKVNQIFAHAFGFRANIDIHYPNYPHHSHQIFRRDVYRTVEQLITQQGFDGRACIFKMFCDAADDTMEAGGMFSKLFKLIFTHKDMTEYEGVSIPFLLSKGCKHINDHCPLNSLNLSPYTDV